MKKASVISNEEQLKLEIVKELFFNVSLSCAGLSMRVGKSLPLVAKAISDLIDAQIVAEIGYAPSNGGRRAVLYSLTKSDKIILAIAMDQLYVRVAAYSLDKELVSQTSVYELELSASDALDKLTALIENYILDKGIDKLQIIGAGIGMPGFIDINLGVNYSFLSTPDGNLQSYLSTSLGFPVFIDNDSSLIALAELKFGAAKGKKNAMVVNISWGVGLGIILNGELFRGHSGFAGEFSHIPLSDNGELCSCGKRGCLETSASLLVVAHKAEEGIKNGRVSVLDKEMKSSSSLTGDLVLQAANNGDQFAIELLMDSGHALGKGFAVLIHILNPETIILSGRGAQVGKLLTTPIQQALYTYAIPRLAESTSLAVSDLGKNAGLLGASALVIEHLGKGVSIDLGKGSSIKKLEYTG